MNIRLDILDNDIYRLTFDRPDSSANVFDRATIDELNRHLQTLSGDTKMSGLLFTSAKKSIFIAGADINELLADDLTDEALREMVREGQQLFSRIAALPIPTVAAIHGACLGGGFELCLACDYRIASDERATKIGLPETSLGILPGWGGCTRLPRLVGLPRALDVILKGRRLAARQARAYGMIDEVVPRELFGRRAAELIAGGKPRRPAHRWTNNALAAALIARRVRPQLERKTRGHYPAVPRALDVVTAGVSKRIDDALALERDAIVQLARTEVSRNLVRVFFLQERAKRLRPEDLAFLGPHMTSSGAAAPGGAVAVVGAGVMGAGIAYWVSTRGRHVLLKDINEEQVRKGLAAIAGLYHGSVKRHILSRVEARQGLDRVTPCAADVPLDRAGLVIEAAVENMEIKKTIFRELAARTPDETILATNTSALSISELGEAAGVPERVIGMHFFNPVHRMPLVEIVVGEQTAPVVIERALRFVQSVGKLPVVARDRPGFVVNRILMPYLTEAGHLFEQGAPVAEIDEAMLDFGMPMGPLRLIDEVGVDVARHVAEFFGRAFGDRMPVPGVLAGLAEAGTLGRKSGAGFYRYARDKKRDPVPSPDLGRFVQNPRAAHMSREDLQERMVLVMLNEAARCLEEDIVAGPRDVDFAMIMGTGFAPFRGGPLRYADHLGAGKVAAGLEHLAENENPRFAPCNLLQTLAAEGGAFYRT